MKLITLGWVAHSLEANEHIIKVSPQIGERALNAIKKMLQVSDEKPMAALAGY
jgi:quinolinate synthase